MTVVTDAMVKSISTNTVIFFCIPEMKNEAESNIEKHFQKASVREIYSRLMTFYNCYPKKNGVTAHVQPQGTALITINIKGFSNWNPAI